MIKKNIPNFITAANLVSGCIGIYFALQSNFVFAAYFVALAAVFDFLDGMMARLLKVHSEIGKQLDSLADMVTFGVLPSFIVFQYLQNNEAGWLSFLAFFMAVCSAFRLAKFNIDTRQGDQFLGLPTPANALFICFLVFLREYSELAFIFTNEGLLVITFLFSVLLVVELPMIALKFKSLKWEENVFRYLIIVFSLIIIGVFQFSGVPIVILLYIFMSAIQYFSIRRN
ncbi:CDP-diacylglycerol--serine O-phosphatidyltransferase [Marivirga sp. S37H4]|uniref:CDP-diacylglycerol--serine O-phosphatidyltransferase n=1 Tax=Marivirga aurantiaca TaxID=2802615 RepID=A0A935CDX5_9BACT|nr:CDP-diacylglycerol--serine O-phosphatidyltransferase [Marivirga aurantiaca]MBK6267373.1 CDP-diacylglycerol--serine O-phosphatidyltransferase [Marivirga aurantiaca]